MDFGVSGDSLTAGDFYGDSKSEIAIHRAGLFYETAFPETIAAPVNYEYWGIAVANNSGRDGDYDGDGKDDETVIFIISNKLNWWIKGSAGTSWVIQWGAVQPGLSTLAFPGADFNGDGREDLIVCNASTSTGSNTWYVGDALTGAQVSWGNFVTDYFVAPDDYTGDGKADFVVYRAGGAGSDAAYWYILNSATGTLVPPVKFGIPDPNFVNNDVPLRGNYDGDDKADIAVYRPSTGVWYWINSSDGSLGVQQWGEPGNADQRPLPAFYNF